MDVPRKALISLFLLTVLASLGCAKTKTTQSVFPKVTPQCQDQALRGRYVVRWETGQVTLYEAPSDEAVMRDLVEKNLEKLQLVEPDFRLFKPEAAGNIPVAAQPAPNNWAAERVNADEAWALGFRGAGITVAVIDSGVDISHPQLRNQLAINLSEIPGNGIDDDMNGFIDDVNGYDFTSNTDRVSSLDRHGTHVSGIIAAEHHDSEAGARSYVQGIAPDAKILPLAFINESGSGSLYDALRAIDYAADRGAQVINASWGGASCSTIMRDQIGGLYAKKILFIAAAGNSGTNIDVFPEYPASFGVLSQITVGATGAFESRASFSNYGDAAVHLFAPGVDIVSTVPSGLEAMSGTSMATPLVSGAIAVLLSARPQAGIDQVRQVLYRSARIDFSYRNVSHGRLDLGAAIRQLTQ